MSYFKKPAPGKPAPAPVGGMFTDIVSTFTGVTVTKPPPFKDLIGTLVSKKNELGQQFGYFTQPSTQGNKSVPKTALWVAYYSIVEPIIQMLPAAKERSAQNTEYPQQAFMTAIERYRSRVGFVTKARADANGTLMLTFQEADVFWNEITRLAIAIHVVYGVPTASQIQAEVIAATITDTAKEFGNLGAKFVASVGKGLDIVAFLLKYGPYIIVGGVALWGYSKIKRS